MCSHELVRGGGLVGWLIVSRRRRDKGNVGSRVVVGSFLRGGMSAQSFYRGDSRFAALGDLSKAHRQGALQVWSTE